MSTPILSKLLSDGVVRVDDGCYVGKAADGMEVIVGWVAEPENTEAYLADGHATPDKW